ncbi:ArnT family glycosyltransferase [Streptomyces sp. NPDC020379]|uniref:ArnT family glycosyltransferase n=1 Tax=Streptomyces sp. NPDC020379 TaxID=3365071 RepID=UPI0037A2403E
MGGSAAWGRLPQAPGCRPVRRLRRGRLAAASPRADISARPAFEDNARSVSRGSGGPPPVSGRGGVGEEARRGRGRAALGALLLGTALLYLWDLSSSGYANAFYAAAAQAGSASWKAFFFGASDAASAITVDKPPASLWPMGLSVRIFGLSSWAILVPEALMGVAAVGVLHATVRRYFGQAAGLLAGAALAVTPVAALMFRFDNPDALLCLLMVCAVACVLRALETAATRWLLLAAFCFGLGFLTKTLQAWLILPPLALLYACCAPVAPLRRARQLLLAGLVLVVSGGWWVAAVELWPASSRPYIGGSQHNSFLELTFGYNGLGRINGDETGSVGGHGGGGAGGGRWGDTGITRLFGTDMGGQIAWLLPAALVLLAAGLWLLRRPVGRDRMRRLAFLAWGGALLMTFLIFSFMSGIFHEYYNIALAPYVSALFAAGAALLWKRGAYPLLALVTVGTAGWAYVLLDRTPHWLPWLKWAVLAAGVLAGGALLLVRRSGKGLARGVAVLAAGSALAAPIAYTLDTVNTAHGGSLVTAGPAVGRGHFGGRGGHVTPGKMPAGRGGGPGAPGGPGGPGGSARSAGKEGRGGSGKTGGGVPGGMPGGMGGLLGGQKVSAAAAAALKRDAGDYTWPAAAVGSQNAASYQLATQVPVMSVGGFNGSDPSPTLRQFQAYVKAGKVHWFIASGESRGGGRGGEQGFGQGFGQGGGRGGWGGPSAEISSWVAAHFTKVTVGTATFYDLTKAR